MSLRDDGMQCSCYAISHLSVFCNINQTTAKSNTHLTTGHTSHVDRSGLSYAGYTFLPGSHTMMPSSKYFLLTACRRWEAHLQSENASIYYIIGI